MRRNTKKKDSGVISLEACIVLPIFIFLILFLYGFMFLFAGEQLVSHSLIQSAVSLSLDSYAVDKLSDASEFDQLLENVVGSILENGKTSHASSEKWYDDSDKIQQEIKTRFVSYLSDGNEDKANEMLERFGVVGGLGGISFTECEVNDDVLTITIEYEQKYIIDAFGLLSYDRTKTITQKMW